MLEFRSADNLALAVQLLYVLVATLRAPKVALSVRLNCCFLYVCFIFPTNLIAQTVSLDSEQTEDVPRSWLYKVKLLSFGSESFGPIYFLLLGMLGINFVLIAFSKRHVVRLVAWHIPVLFFFSLGMISAAYNPLGIEFKNLGYAVREFFAISFGLSAGTLIVMSGKSVETLDMMVTDLCLIIVIGCVPYGLADSSVLWTREFDRVWLLPSQSAVLPGYFAMSLWFFKGKRKIKKLIAIFVALLSLYSASKDSFFIYLMILAIAALRISADHLRKYQNVTVLMIIAWVAIGNIVPIFVSHYWLVEPLPSLETRYFQTVNALAAIWDGGTTQLLFGLGWNQWYPLSQSFPFVDWMSGPLEEVTSTDARYMLSVPFVATLRSIGLVGLIGMIGFIFYVGKGLMKHASKFGPLMAVVCFTVLVNFCFTAVTGQVESMMFISMIVAILGMKEVIEVNPLAGQKVLMEIAQTPT